jgi:hypothetical protein
MAQASAGTPLREATQEITASHACSRSKAESAGPVNVHGIADGRALVSEPGRTGAVTLCPAAISALAVARPIVPVAPSNKTDLGEGVMPAKLYQPLCTRKADFHPKHSNYRSPHLRMVPMSAPCVILHGGVGGTGLEQ